MSKRAQQALRDTVRVLLADLPDSREAFKRLEALARIAMFTADDITAAVEDGRYTIPSVEANASFIATFSRVPVTLSLSSGEGGRPLLRTLNIQAAEVLGFGYALHEVSAQADAYDGGWLGRVVSREAQGGFDWLDRGAGRLEARLARLHLDSSAAQKDAAAAVADEPDRGA